MRFAFEQSVAVPPPEVVAAYGSPAFYEGRPRHGDIAVVEVVDHRDEGDQVLIDVRFSFNGSVSAAVRKVIDPAKMSWVTHAVIYPDESRTRWEVLPDHYPDRLTSSGSYHFAPVGDADTGTVVRVDGDLTVHVPILGRSVERVIVSGLRDYVKDEVASLPDVRRRP